MKTSATYAFITIIMILAGTVGGYAAVIDTSVSKVVATAPASTTIDILIQFNDDLDLAALKMSQLKEKRSRQDIYRDVMNRLTDNRSRLEKSIRPVLETMRADGQIESYTFFTVSRTVLITTRVDNVANLAELPGAQVVYINEPVSLIEPVEEADVTAYAKAALANSALETVNIRSLWDRGLTGAGGLICSFDTGVEGDHPAVSAKWRGNHGATSAESWFAPHSGLVPTDNIGHGTHTMGILVGSTASDTIGIAPDAQWISAAVIDQGASFSTTIADILSAFDWALNPDGDLSTTDDVPDVICNSWGIPRGIFGDCDETFWTAIDNVEAAGIITIFAAGNEGPEARSLRHPANRASSPTNTLSVGAVDQQTLVIADFSSRGPATCDGVSIKPEVVAPGVGIYSSYKDGGYRVMSGTSMAAPFVAGLVLLMRQYNPEATVEEIKNALMESALDLGPVGEDNSYGHGLIDASRVLIYMPPPELPNIAILNHTITAGGDAFADPGETANLNLALVEPTGLADSVDVWVTSLSDLVTVDPDTVRYRFATGSTYAVSLTPFILTISTNAIAGDQVDLLVNFGFMRGMGTDTLTHTITIGHQLPGRIYTVEAGDMRFGASDFGQFGFGMGSIYQAGGAGFTFMGSNNLLYEGGLIVARSEQMVSDALRGGSGQFEVSAFTPGITANKFAANFDETMTDSYADNNADLPIPVTVEQAVFQSAQNFAIVQFTVVNPTPERVDRLAFGMFLDFDFDRATDRIGFDTLMGMMYQYNEALGIYVGLTGVSANEFGYLAAIDDGPEKRGFTVAEKHDFVDRTGIAIADTGAGDWHCVISRTATQIDGFGSRKMAVVIASASSLPELRTAILAGMDEYNLYLDTDDNIPAVPSLVELRQNYPNPFNPETTIKFALGSAQQTSLVVYNITGQKVRTLFDDVAQAGEHTVIWDGCNESGQTVASGMYFYQLTTVQETQSRKMVFLK